MIFFGKHFPLMNEEGTGASGGGVVMSGDAAAAAVAAAQAAAAAPVAAPAAAPAAAAPAAPAAATPAEPAGKEGEDGSFEWVKTGHASLDIALGWLGKQGLGETNELVQLAARTGNFDGLKAHFAQNATPGSAEMLSILESSFKDYVETQNANIEKETASQVEFLGGPERANAVIEWASTNAEPAEKQAFNAMMDAGGFQARAALAYVSSLYDKHTGTSEHDAIVGAQVTNGNAGRGGPQAPTTPISRVQFAEEGQKLYQQYGEGYQQTAAYRALARRVQR
ncbi:scaffolding protein [Burkholderia phage JG068]|uniref:Scaffolding protein n=1 Tax=Burkholderia phage JG068 TaxID=1401297 RepID=U3PIQ2_9CAUD|nr:head scaffolding protein [Burkholderia phage JG068]AGW43615.1 scaffolding protein [Burkholderia phage JG068]